MKYMIASDIHGSAYYCEQLLQAYQTEQTDRLLLLGDILYHGPRNDLPRDYAPKKVIEILNAQKQQILCVRGNCDTEVDHMVWEFPVLTDYALIVDNNCTIYATYSHNLTKLICPLYMMETSFYVVILMSQAMFVTKNMCI